MDEILHRTPQHIDLKIEYPKIHRLQFVLVYMISYHHLPYQNCHVSSFVHFLPINLV